MTADEPGADGGRDDGERDESERRHGERPDDPRSRGGERACYLRICPECDATCSIADERCPDCGAALESEPTAE